MYKIKLIDFKIGWILCVRSWNSFIVLQMAEMNSKFAKLLPRFFASRIASSRSMFFIGRVSRSSTSTERPKNSHTTYSCSQKARTVTMVGLEGGGGRAVIEKRKNYLIKTPCVILFLNQVLLLSYH